MPGQVQDLTYHLTVYTVRLRRWNERWNCCLTDVISLQGSELSSQSVSQTAMPPAPKPKVDWFSVTHSLPPSLSLNDPNHETEMPLQQCPLGCASAASHDLRGIPVINFSRACLNMEPLRGLLTIEPFSNQFWQCESWLGPNKFWTSNRKEPLSGIYWIKTKSSRYEMSPQFCLPFSLDDTRQPQRKSSTGKIMV